MSEEVNARKDYIVWGEIPKSLNKKQIYMSVHLPEGEIDFNYWKSFLLNGNKRQRFLFIVSDERWKELFKDKEVQKLNLTILYYIENDSKNGGYYLDNTSGWFYRYVRKEEYVRFCKALKTNNSNRYCICTADGYRDNTFFFTNSYTKSAIEASNKCSLFLKKEGDYAIDPSYRLEFRIGNNSENAINFSIVDKETVPVQGGIYRLERDGGFWEFIVKVEDGVTFPIQIKEDIAENSKEYALE